MGGVRWFHQVEAKPPMSHAAIVALDTTKRSSLAILCVALGATVGLLVWRGLDICS